MREYPTRIAHVYEGKMTYIFGYLRLRDVARAKASVVWPEGKEGLPHDDSFCMSGYVI
mgnify:CR=1 FL=1